MNKIFFMMLVPAFSIIVGCGGSGGSTTRIGVATLYAPGFATTLKDPGVRVDYISPEGSHPEDGRNHNVNGSLTTNSNAYAEIRGAAVPGTYAFTRYPSSNCSQSESYTRNQIPNQSTVNLICGQPFREFSSAPQQLDFNITPAAVEVTNDKNAFSSVYGMPYVDIYDESGNLRTTTQATWMQTDGNRLRLTFPRNASMYSGDYALIIRNVNADGSRTGTGGSWLGLYNHDEPPPDPDSCTVNRTYC